MPAFLGASLTDMDARRCCRRWSCESIDVDRSRKVRFGRIARKPAPMLVPHRLTVRMTAKKLRASRELKKDQQLRRLVDDRVGVGGFRGRSGSIEIDRESRRPFRSVYWDTDFRSRVSGRMQGQPTSRPEYPRLAQSSVRFLRRQWARMSARRLAGWIQNRQKLGASGSRPCHLVTLAGTDGRWSGMKNSSHDMHLRCPALAFVAPERTRRARQPRRPNARGFGV